MHSIKDLVDDMYMTKSSRFNADRRLNNEHKLSHFALMCLSVYIILISSAPLFDVFPWVNSEVCNFCSFILSIFLLGTAALEAGHNRSKQAHKLHENAVRINELCKKNLETSNYEEIANEYKMALASCEYNHSEIDYRKAQLNNNHLDGKTRAYALIVWFILWIKHFGFYWLCIVLPAIGMVYFLISQTPENIPQ